MQFSQLGSQFSVGLDKFTKRRGSSVDKSDIAIVAKEAEVGEDAPVDFLVKNLVQSDSTFFVEALLSNYSFLSFCELCADESTSSGSSPNSLYSTSTQVTPLPFAFIRFYEAHNKLDDMIKWTVSNDFDTATLFDPSVNKMILWLFHLGSGHRYLHGIITRLIDRLSEWERTTTALPNFDNVECERFLLEKLQTVLPIIFDLDSFPLFIREALLIAVNIVAQKDSSVSSFQVLSSLLIQQFLVPAIAHPLDYELASANALTQPVRMFLLQTTKIITRLIKTTESQKEKGIDPTSVFINKHIPVISEFCSVLIDPSSISACKRRYQSAPYDTTRELIDPVREVLSEDDAYRQLHATLTANQRKIDYNIPSNSELYAQFFTGLLKHTVNSSDWLPYSDDNRYQVMHKKRDKYDNNGIMMKASRNFHCSVRKAFDFLHDIQAIPKTDATAVEARVVKTYHETRRMIYIKNKMTFPLQDRDSVFMQHDVISEDETEAILAGHSIETPLIPVYKGVERVFLLTSGFYIESLGEKKCRVTYLINLESNTPVPTTIVQMLVKQIMKTKLNIKHFLTDNLTEKKKAKVHKAEKYAAKICGVSSPLSMSPPSGGSFMSRHTPRAIRPLSDSLRESTGLQVGNISPQNSSSDITPITLDKDVAALEEMVYEMLSSINVKDRYYNRELIKKCFLGHQAAQWFIDSGHCSNIPEAIVLGNKMVDAGIISHVMDPKQRFLNNDQYYKFNIFQSTELRELEKQVRSEELNETVRYVKDNEEKIMAIEAIEKLVQQHQQEIEKLKQSIANSPQSNDSNQLKYCILLFAITFILEWLFSFLSDFTRSVLIATGLTAVIVLLKSNIFGFHEKMTPTRTSSGRELNEQPVASPASIPTPSLVPAGKAETIATVSIRKFVHPDVKRLRDALNAEYSDVATKLFTDSYLLSVIQSNNRGLLKSQQKLLHALKIREEYGGNTIQIADVQQQLNQGSMYWYGYDKSGHPILWVRPRLKNYKKIDVKRELQMHILMIEDAITQLLPEGINTFTLVSDTNGLGMTDFDLQLMKGLMQLITSVYPERMEAMYVGPVNMFVRMGYKILSPTLPEKLLSKVHLMNDPQENLLDRLHTDQVPDFFKGSAIHPSYRTQDGNFSYQEMIEVQKKLLMKLNSNKT